MNSDVMNITFAFKGQRYIADFEQLQSQQLEPLVTAAAFVAKFPIEVEITTGEGKCSYYGEEAKTALIMIHSLSDGEARTPDQMLETMKDDIELNYESFKYGLEEANRCLQQETLPTWFEVC